MRISSTPNATPQSTPPSNTGSRAQDSARDEHFIWRSLVSRLVHPMRLQIVEALIEKGRPMTISELAPLVPLASGNTDLVRYHAEAMTEAGALELAGSSQAQSEENPAEPTFFFALSE